MDAAPLGAEGATPTFSRGEYETRLARVQATLSARGLDAAILLAPESINWTTGFFTRGYTNFILAVVPAHGEPSLYCRRVARYYAEKTFVFADAVYWTDGADVTGEAIRFVAERVAPGARCAIELGAWSLDARRWERLKAAAPFALVDDAETIANLRLVKSPSEIALQRRAGMAAEAGMAAGRLAAVAGTTERELAAEVIAALVRAGSDTAGPGPLSSGERTFHLHGGFTDRVLRHGDTVQLECTPSVRHYNARFMRTIKVGAATDEERRRLDKIIAVQDAALATVGPGIPARVPDRAYRQGLVNAELVADYTNKTMYSIGLIMPPGGESLEATPSADWTLEPGMTFHTYLLVKDFGFSESIVITDGGYERLTNYPREMIVA